MLFNLRLGVLAVVLVRFAAICNAAEAFFATAIVTDANNHSALECWKLDADVSISMDPASAGAASVELGDLANATYNVFPPNFYSDIHNAPHPQWVVFTSGLAVVTLPSNTGTAYVRGGQNGIIIAVDTVGTGHYTSYPSNSETASLFIPFQGGAYPAHSVVAEGPCIGNQLQNVTTTE